jgi:hypothetical protein
MFDLRDPIESFPRVRDYWPSGHRQEKLVDIRSHARPFAGRDDHCANHGAFLGGAGELCKAKSLCYFVERHAIGVTLWLWP